MQDEAVKLSVSQVLTLLNAAQTKIHHTTGLAGRSHWAGIPNMAFLFYLGAPAEQANINYSSRTRTSQFGARLCFVMAAYDFLERLLCHLPACPWSCLQFCKRFQNLWIPFLGSQHHRVLLEEFSWSQHASNTLWMSPLKVGVCSLSLVTFSLTSESMKIWLILRPNKDFVWESIKT